MGKCSGAGFSYLTTTASIFAAETGSNHVEHCETNLVFLHTIRVLVRSCTTVFVCITSNPTLIRIDKDPFPNNTRGLSTLPQPNPPLPPHHGSSKFINGLFAHHHHHELFSDTRLFPQLESHLNLREAETLRGAGAPVGDGRGRFRQGVEEEKRQQQDQEEGGEGGESGGQRRHPRRRRRKHDAPRRKDTGN